MKINTYLLTAKSLSKGQRLDRKLVEERLLPLLETALFWRECGARGSSVSASERTEFTSNLSVREEILNKHFEIGKRFGFRRTDVVGWLKKLRSAGREQ